MVVSSYKILREQPMFTKHWLRTRVIRIAPSCLYAKDVVCSRPTPIVIVILKHKRPEAPNNVLRIKGQEEGSPLYLSKLSHCGVTPWTKTSMRAAEPAGEVLSHLLFCKIHLSPQKLALIQTGAVSVSLSLYNASPLLDFSPLFS